MGTEQRKNIRLLVKDGVIVALRSGVIKMGRIKDIGRGGLSFEHIYRENLSRDPLKGVFLSGANKFRLSKISCKVVYNIPLHIPNQYQGFTIHFITGRCGVQFETLNEDQMTQLEFFLKTYTKGITP